MAVPPALDWHALTRTGFAAIDRPRALVVVTCSPLEVHGPHLPLGADAIQGEALAARVRVHLSSRHGERPWLRLPLLFTASDVVPQPGSLHFAPRTTIRVLCELGASLARQGFRDVVVSNFHGGERHVLAIEAACERVRRRHGLRMLSLFSLLRAQMAREPGRLARALEGAEGVAAADFAGDTHGGVLETAQLLALCGERVEPGYRALPRQTIDAWRGGPGGRRRGLRRVASLWERATDFEYFAAHTYSGSPALASPALGERILDALAEASAQALADVLDGRLAPAHGHAPRWRRTLHLHPLYVALVDRVLGLRSPIA